MRSHSARVAQRDSQIAPATRSLTADVRAVEFEYRRRITDDVREILSRTKAFGDASLPTRGLNFEDYDRLRDAADEIVRYFTT